MIFIGDGLSSPQKLPGRVLQHRKTRDLARMVERQTHRFEGAAPQGVRVQIPPWAPR